MAGGRRSRARAIVRTVAGIMCLLSGMFLMLAALDKDSSMGRMELVFCSCILILVSLELSSD